MTAVLGPRLRAALSDLGIPHAFDPSPRRRELAPHDPNALDPTSPLVVRLELADVVPGEVESAGLAPVHWHGPRAASGEILPRDVPRLAAVDGVLEIELSREEAPTLHSSVPATKADVVRTGAFGLDGTGVLVGVVDTGIDIFHHAFRKADGSTRIFALLDTTSPFAFEGHGSPTGGNFTISWIPPDGAAMETTAPLPFDATGAQVRDALEALAAIEPGDALVTGGPLPGAQVRVKLAGRYLHQDTNPLTVTNSTITPGGARIRIERGQELDEAQINTALAAPPSVAATWDANGHGTHVMGIAAGDGSQSGTGGDGASCHGDNYYVGVAPGADLIVVKTTFKNTDTVRGVEWIFTKAAERAAANPPDRGAVVNLSLGGQSGAHDGSDWDERRYDTLLTTTPTARSIVIAAGNDGAPYDHTNPRTQPRRGGGQHSRKAIAAGDVATMTIIISPDDEVDDWFEIWYGGNARLSFQITSPGGDSLAAALTPAAGAGNNTAEVLEGANVDATSTLEASTTLRHRIDVRIAPPAGGSIPDGDWVVELSETAGHAVDVDAWISLDKSDPHPRFADGDQDLTRTMTTPGTAHNAITVASYDYRDRTLARSSGRGPSIDHRDDKHSKPDLAAPGVGIFAARSGARNTGICCDCCADFYVTMSGTSMAAPHVTGVVALLMQRNRTLEWDGIRTILRESADEPDPVVGPNLPDFEWGAGVVNAEAAVTAAPAVVLDDGGADLTSAIDDGELRVPARVPSARAAVAPGGAAAAPFAALRAAILATPKGQLAASLVSTHLDEALRLVSTRRRVTVAWHRMAGPELLREIVQSDPAAVRIPTEVAGKDVRSGLERFLRELEAEGSLPLRTDIARHRTLLLSLPGLDLTALAANDAPTIDAVG